MLLVPSTGGVFEVDLNDERVYSKKATGKHPEFDDLMRTLRQLVA